MPFENVEYGELYPLNNVLQQQIYTNSAIMTSNYFTIKNSAECFPHLLDVEYTALVDEM
jgi:hypothetical protein